MIYNKIDLSGRQENLHSDCNLYVCCVVLLCISNFISTMVTDEHVKVSLAGPRFLKVVRTVCFICTVDVFIDAIAHAIAHAHACVLFCAVATKKLRGCLCALHARS